MQANVLSSCFVQQRWETIPKDCLKEYFSFYETTRQNHTALHWSRDRMISTLHLFYCRSSGLTPQSVAELDLFWKTGNIPTQKPTFIATNSPCISAKRPWKSLRALQHDASRQTFNLRASLWTSFSHFSWSQLPHWQFKNFVAQQQPMPKLLVARRVDGNGTVRQRKKKYTTAACSEVFFFAAVQVLQKVPAIFFLAGKNRNKTPKTNNKHLRQFCIVRKYSHGDPTCVVCSVRQICKLKAIAQTISLENTIIIYL